MTWREQTSSILLAGIFAMLIWFWAEGEKRESQSGTTRVRLTAPAETGRFEVTIPSDQSYGSSSELEVRIELEGPSLALQRAFTRLSTLRLSVREPQDGLERRINLLDKIQRLLQEENFGVTVVGVQPPEVMVRIDEVTERRVGIDLNLPDVEIEAMTIEPDRALLAMTRRNWTWAEGLFGDRLVEMDLPVERLRGVAPGEQVILNDVPLRLKPQLESRDRVELHTASVDVTLQVRLRIDSITWNVPLRISKPPREEMLYDVIIAQEHELFTEVIITGDADLIRRLQAREIRVVAELDFTTDELERGITTKRVDWRLPAGLTVQYADLAPGQAPEIPVEIRRRQQP